MRSRPDFRIGRRLSRLRISHTTLVCSSVVPAPFSRWYWTSQLVISNFRDRLEKVTKLTMVGAHLNRYTSSRILLHFERLT